MSTGKMTLPRTTASEVERMDKGNFTRHTVRQDIPRIMSRQEQHGAAAWFYRDAVQKLVDRLVTEILREGCWTQVRLNHPQTFRDAKRDAQVFELSIDTLPADQPAPPMESCPQCGGFWDPELIKAEEAMLRSVEGVTETKSEDEIIIQTPSGPKSISLGPNQILGRPSGGNLVPSTPTEIAERLAKQIGWSPPTDWSSGRVLPTQQITQDKFKQAFQDQPRTPAAVPHWVRPPHVTATEVQQRQSNLAAEFRKVYIDDMKKLAEGTIPKVDSRLRPAVTMPALKGV